MMMSRREDLDPGGVLLPGEHRAGVAPERDRHHRGHDRVGRVRQPGGDAGEVAVTESLRHVLQQAPGRRVAGAQLGERIALQSRDDPGDQERHPYCRPRHLAGRAQQREDSRPHHRPDSDEGGLAHRQVLLRGCGDGSLGLVHQRHALLSPLTWCLAGISSREGRAPAGSCSGAAPGRPGCPAAAPGGQEERRPVDPEAVAGVARVPDEQDREHHRQHRDDHVPGEPRGLHLPVVGQPPFDLRQRGEGVRDGGGDAGHQHQGGEHGRRRWSPGS